VYKRQVLGLGAIILTSMSGAITALGDTLFPIEPTIGPGLLAHVRDELSPANHFLVRLRAFHPMIAVLASALLLVLGNHLAGRRDVGPAAPKWAIVLMVAVLTEVGVGIFNVVLAAPGWLQLMHLFVAQLVWISATLTLASVLTASPDAEAA